MSNARARTTWSIGEVARRASLHPSAIRFYERIGLLPAPARVSGRRRYTPAILRHLALIDVARRAGFRLQEIRSLRAIETSSTTPSRRWRALAARKLPEVDALIARAEMKRLLLEGAACDCRRLDDCRLLDA